MLQGGAGNDVLKGGGGNDTYIFNRDGHDFIDDFGGAAIDFGAGIAPSDVTVSKLFTGELILSFAGSGDLVMFPAGDIFGDAGMPLETVKFADGTVWSAADVLARVTDMQSVSGANDGGTVTVDCYVAQGLTMVNLGFGFGYLNAPRLHGVTPGDIDLERVGDGSLYFDKDSRSSISARSRRAPA